MASAEAKFGLPEPKRGLVAGAGGIMRLPRRIPYHVAMEIALTGDHYPASRLYELGLVNRVTEPGEALEAALELARKIAANAPLALAATKRVIVESQRLVAGGDVRQAGRDHQPGVRLEGRAWRAPRPSPRSALRSGRASNPPPRTTGPLSCSGGGFTRPCGFLRTVKGHDHFGRRG